MNLNANLPLFTLPGPPGYHIFHGAYKTNYDVMQHSQTINAISMEQETPGIYNNISLIKTPCTLE